MKVILPFLSVCRGQTQVQDTLTMNLPIQTECHGDQPIHCDSKRCGKWVCSVKNNQLACYGRCKNSSRSGVKKCSCLEDFGPIQVAVPCKWTTIEEATCSPVKPKPRRRIKNNINHPMQNDFAPSAPVEVDDELKERAQQIRTNQPTGLVSSQMSLQLMESVMSNTKSIHETTTSILTKIIELARHLFG